MHLLINLAIALSLLNNPARIAKSDSVEIDSGYLALVADSFKVPHDVVFAVAWKETRTGRNWNQLGPGILDTIIVRDTTQTDEDGNHNFFRLKIVHRCRETGRFQMQSCVDFTKILNDPICSAINIRTKYPVSVHCGIKYLAFRHNEHRKDGTLRCPTWIDVIACHNGSGKKAKEYLQDALSYIGWLHARQFK